MTERDKFCEPWQYPGSGEASRRYVIIGGREIDTANIDAPKFCRIINAVFSTRAQEIRAEALEEAARICDVEAKAREERYKNPLPGDDRDIQAHKGVTAFKLAAAIRKAVDKS